MSAPAPPIDLLDLKFLPSWVKEPSPPNEYSDFAGEEPEKPPRWDERAPRRRDKPPRRGRREEKRTGRGERGVRRDTRWRDENRPPLLPAVTVRFLPHEPSLENVIAQIKSGSFAYSLFALARLFLERPERYSVRLHVREQSELFQLGDDGPVSTNRPFLEDSAFALAKNDFYKIDVVQTDPIKGNFTNVARCRASGTLLGPTNHHSYQAQLRNLYEQRFSRRFSFADYQRQIEIVNDPAAVEQWREQARNVTTYTTTRSDPPVSFNTAAEAERHFRQNYLAGLIRSAPELKISGVLSRHLPDRALGRAIENAWAHETRSPSGMMQELAGALRQAGLHIFRHRRGMLFVSPIRLRSFKHELDAVSPAISAILETIGAAPGIHRKDLAEKLIPAQTEDAEKLKLNLAADLKWLISAGYVIEFNDGSLDLPRVKPPNDPKKDSTSENGTAVAAVTEVQTRTPEPDAPATSSA